ncbi:MAG: hypothetical protein ACTHLJ_04695 [Angustibacter sp.]
MPSDAELDVGDGLEGGALGELVVAAGVVGAVDVGVLGTEVACADVVPDAEGLAPLLQAASVRPATTSAVRAGLT